MLHEPEEGWSFNFAYDSRFATIQVVAVNPAGERIAYVHVPFAEILHHLKIPPHELRAHLKDAEEPVLQPENIEAIRLRTVEGLNVEGKVVLDVGGYMGWFAGIAKDRGAAPDPATWCSRVTTGRIWAIATSGGTIPATSKPPPESGSAFNSRSFADRSARRVPAMDGRNRHPGGEPIRSTLPMRPCRT